MLLQGEEYVKVNVTVMCKGDQTLTEPEMKRHTQSLLTEDEADANYRSVHLTRRLCGVL